ncbi:MAG TPA: response regulator [Candidatus Kryptonia bacterium]|nr:response regulator [Candidatus Kryptonia bacterium]
MIDALRPPILLVEDDDGHARLLERTLRRAGLGHRIVRVADGQDALDYLAVADGLADTDQHPRPGLILLDIRMPRLDGFEVLAHVRSDPVHRHTPIIMLTSTDNQHEVNRAYELGASGYVVKPVNVDLFTDRVITLGRFLDLVELPDAAHAGSDYGRHPAG